MDKQISKTIQVLINFFDIEAQIRSDIFGIFK